MTAKRIDYLFHSYIAGTCSDNEKAELMRLIRDAEHDASLQRLIANLWEEFAREQHTAPHAADRVFTQILEMEQSERLPVRAQRKALRIWWSIAAAAVLIGIGVWAIVMLRQSATEEGWVSRLALDGHEVITLPDGSVVVLHEGGEIRFPITYEGHAEREVALAGKAYFDVKHAENLPFIVQAKHTKTTVLGTAFTIDAMPDNEVVVTVNRGRVKVEDRTQTTQYGILSADQRLVVKSGERNGGITSVPNPMPEWVDQVVYFDDETMLQAAAKLEQKFGVRVIVGSEAVANCRFTAGFSKGESLDHILKVITLFNNAAYAIDTAAKIVRIEGEGCPATNK